MISPQQHNPALTLAINQFREVANKASDASLARIYRGVASAMYDSPCAPHIKKYWLDIMEVLNVSSDNEIASSFKVWIDKQIAEGKDHKITRDFLLNIANAIIEVNKRS